MVKKIRKAFGKALAVLIQEGENRHLICVLVLSDCQGVEALSQCAQKKHFVFSPEVRHNTQYSIKVQRRKNSKCATEKKTSEIHDYQD